MSQKGLPVIRKGAAGIDIGSRNLHVSIDSDTVEVFTTYTESLSALVSYLQKNSIITVAMEATGVLWLPIYDVLEAAGIEVYLVNGYHARNIADPKSDFRDSRWLQKLHSCGLLRASFVPKDHIRQLRVYIRQRETHVESAAQHVQRIQKSFELMNLKLHNVISDIKGASGVRIIEAILRGERHPKKLLKLCDEKIIKHKDAEVIQSLIGNYQAEYLFLLEQSYQAYNFYQSQIMDCDKKIENLLKEITKDLPVPPESPSKPARHNQPKIENLHDQLVQMSDGRNASSLPGLSDKMVLKLISELGTDLSRWPTDKHFVSYLGLSPVKRQSGKMNRTRRLRVTSIAGQIFRESAMSIANSKYLALKGFYNRIKSKSGYKVAIKATARKLAILYYKLMRNGFDYVEQGLAKYEEMYREKMLKSLTKKAGNFGFKLVEI